MPLQYKGETGDKTERLKNLRKTVGVTMQFGLRVICNHRITPIVKERVEALANYICLSDDLSFSSYWKDDECDILEIGATINNPDYSKIKQYVHAVSGAENIFQRCIADEWEFAYFASLDELHSTKDIAFVDCNIF